MEAIVKIDEQGRISLPSGVLDALHFTTPGDLKAQASNGKLEITPLRNPVPATMSKENGVLVAVNSGPFDAVAALDAVRAERL
jgi:hypothetical protein